MTVEAVWPFTQLFTHPLPAHTFVNPHVATTAMHTTALSINLNKVALMRNTRHLGLPSVVNAATRCLSAGAAGITVHPRPDERHIRAADVADLAALLKDWPGREYNIEGNPFQNLMGFIRTHKPHQATFVPDSESQATSDHGWNLQHDADRLRPLIQECHDLGVRVSLFMDPEPGAMQRVNDAGADRIELYTETYARAFGSVYMAQVTSAFTATAHAASDAGLGINAGHDLNLQNIAVFLRHVPGVQEVSIGHAFVGDALDLGYSAAVTAYLAAMAAAQAQPQPEPQRERENGHERRSGLRP